MWHVRRQLAFDVWPLALGVLIIACCERNKLMSSETSSWFSLFRIIFECTSGRPIIFSAELRLYYRLLARRAIDRNSE